MSDQLHRILKSYWGYDAFRPMQEDVMQSVLQGKDTLALMPTGGGKSLCYQVPGMAIDGTTLVISPLIALMKDQVGGLRKRGITAYAIFSGMSRKEVLNTLEVVSESNCKFLYVSPERLETALFLEYLPGLNIKLIAVDEAHCISQWGYDFRPPYLRIADLRKELPGVPVLALTASATPDVQEDICLRLTIDQQGYKQGSWNIFRQSFERPNISYSRFLISSKINKIADILTGVPGTAIVYCKSRKRTEELTELLLLQGVKADFYHAGLSQDDRNRKQEAWLNNEVRVIVCTNAFGMGIDKPDVRVVIHADTPDCLENYYQEAGRAGRDGQKAYAVLLYTEKDLAELEDGIEAKFPSLGEVREVYQAVANYLQVPAGTGAGHYYEFDVRDFAKKFKLSPITTINALRILEQGGWLSFNEQVFLPATVIINAHRRYIEEFEEKYPDLEPLIKTLLRTYEGIVDRAVFISEMQLAQILRTDVENIKNGLAKLAAAKMILYNPRMDKPQVFYVRPRIQTELLSIDAKMVDQRKQVYLQRILTMINFVREETVCRSEMIGRYFGDEKMKKCGVCDNCLRVKNDSLSSDEFASISRDILKHVGRQPIGIKALLLQLNQTPERKIWKTIEFLEKEGLIKHDGEGRVIRT